MTTRAQDLTADLLSDIAAHDDNDAPAPTAAPAPAAQPVAAASDEAPSAFVDAQFYLAPSTWQRPRLSLAARSFAVSAGPVRLRLGRR